MYLKKLLLALLLAVPVTLPLASLAEEPNAAVQREIDHLLGFVHASTCDFYRNGKWYPASEALEHIRMKYRYVQKRGLVKSAEDFINYAASESSISGKPYKVRCGDTKEILSSDWLLLELRNFRDSR